MQSELSINNLNDVCLGKIFRFLTLPERWIASTVCPGWSLVDEKTLHFVNKLDTSQRLWFDIFHLQDREEIHLIMQDILSKYGQFIKYLKFDYMNGDVFREYTFPFAYIIASCPNLENLIILCPIQFWNLSYFVREYKNIVEFRFKEGVQFSDDILSELFQTNVNLKYVEINLYDGSANCLWYLTGKLIQELTIYTPSFQVVNQLIMVLESLSVLNTLGIEYYGLEDLTGLMSTITRCETIRNLTIRVPTLSNEMLNSLSQLDQLIKLNLRFENSIMDQVFTSTASKLINLKSLDVSGCRKVTDRGLTALSQLRNIEELNISGLAITGQGLQNHQRLRYLNCLKSKICDAPLCRILRQCDNLQLINVGFCPNVTLATIETAQRLALTKDDNDIPLRMITDLGLISKLKIKVSPLLELLCPEFFPWFDTRDLGNFVYDSLFDIVKFLDDNHQIVTRGPILNDDCLFEIFKTMSFADRTRMKIVSAHWQCLIEYSWFNMKTFDLSSPEWKLFSQTKTQDEINETWGTVGKHLKRLVVGEYCNISTIVENCPQLRILDLQSCLLNPSDIIRVSNCYRNLNELSISTVGMGDALTNVFRSNQRLKTLNLCGMDSTQMKCLLHLNPGLIETLKLYEASIDARDDSAKSSFLMNFVLMDSRINSNLAIQSVKGCNRLEMLVLELSFWETGWRSVNTFFGMKNLQMLCLPRFNQVTDSFLVGLRQHNHLISHVDITDCVNVTDEGIRIIADLPNLRTLIINGTYNILGYGLSSLSGTTFRQLECQNCYLMFSEPLCNILDNCPNLQLLNIVNCRNVNETVIDTAFRVTANRTNEIMLKIISHETLIRVQRKITPPLLELLMVGTQKSYVN